MKARLYAAGGVADYWVVGLGRDEIVVYRDPAGGTFDSVTRHSDGIVRALRHPAVAVDVRALLR